MSPAQMVRSFILHKPYGMLCQFTGPGRSTLADLGPFPRDVYPAGRLDADSEGLVLLTNDGALKHLLLEPKFGHPRTYLVQIERIPSQECLNRLRRGVVIDNDTTRPAEVRLLDVEPDLPARTVPIRFRKNVPTCWIEMTIREGRNRQVRRMTAAVGHPTLRLVRVAIGNLRLGELKPGEFRELTCEEHENLEEECKQMAQPKPAHNKERIKGKA
jgi:23S rRNA pseudouridine2457 synthase